MRGGGCRDLVCGLDDSILTIGTDGYHYRIRFSYEHCNTAKFPPSPVKKNKRPTTPEQKIHLPYVVEPPLFRDKATSLSNVTSPYTPSSFENNTSHNAPSALNGIARNWNHEIYTLGPLL